MLIKFLFNVSQFLYGEEVSVDALIRSPLKPNEILMQDSWGGFRRIKAPEPSEDSWFNHTVFWLQTYMNGVDSVKAIENLFASLSDRVNTIDLTCREVFNVLSGKAEGLKSSFLKGTHFRKEKIEDLAAKCSSKIKATALIKLWGHVQALSDSDVAEIHSQYSLINKKIDKFLGVFEENDTNPLKSIAAKLFNEKKDRYKRKENYEKFMSEEILDDKPFSKQEFPSKVERALERFFSNLSD